MVVPGEDGGAGDKAAVGGAGRGGILQCHLQDSVLA